MYVLLGAALAIAGGSTSRTADVDGWSQKTKGGDEPQCHKTNSDCSDYIVTNIDEYTRLLDHMIDGLVFLDDPIHELDVGHGGTSVTGDLDSADIFTEKLGGGLYREHWFLNDNELLENPGQSFDIFYNQYRTKPQMQDYLNVSGYDPSDRMYVEMDIQYSKVPDTDSTTQLNMGSDLSVQRFLFSGTLNNGSSHAAHLLREVFRDASGDEVDRVDHWVFMNSVQGNSFELLDTPGETLHMTHVGAATPSWFYDEYGDDPLVRGVAITRYHAIPASDAEFFNSP